MSLFNSVLGSLSPSPKFRRSFEDPHAREHELPLHNKPSSPPIPPPIASTILWNAPRTSTTAPSRVPDDLLALQRRARHLEQQLQELLDAQADGLTSGLGGNDSTPDDLISNGSTTPTVSSIRDDRTSAEGEDYGRSRKKKVGLNAARRGIFRRIQQLASVKAEEMDFLDDNLTELKAIVEKAETWAQKRSRLERKIEDIEGDSKGARTKELYSESSKLEQEIRQKEEELWALKVRQRTVLTELADSENSVEARLSSYKGSLSILDKEIASFLARPPETGHMPLSKSPFLSLPSKRRTLEMAHDYWEEEHTRLVEKCQDVDVDRAALDEGAILWNKVVKRVMDFEASLQEHMQQLAKNSSGGSSELLENMDSTISFVEDALEQATSRSWNLLVCAIGAELEAFKQGKEILEEALGSKRKGKKRASERLVDTDSSHADSEEEGSLSAIRISRSSPKSSAPLEPTQKFFSTDDDDPDPELMISHQDTDTD